MLTKNIINRSKYLTAFMFSQFLLFSNTYAIDVSINGSQNLTLINDIIFDYEANPKIIDFDIVDPFVCSKFFNDPLASIVLNVNNVLRGNLVTAANFDYANGVFNINTDSTIQCASQFGLHNDVIFNHGFEQNAFDLEIILKDFNTGDVLNAGSNIELYDGQEYKYIYELHNNSSQEINADLAENFLQASPYFHFRNNIDKWECTAISGVSSDCSTNSIGPNHNGTGFVSLSNAIIGVGGQLNVVVTRLVKVDTVGPNEKLDLLAAVFLNGNNDTNNSNNVSFTSFGTTLITATHLQMTSKPNNAVAGDAMNNVVVELLDVNGVLDANNNSLVSITIEASSPSGGTLGVANNGTCNGNGTATVAAVSGVATFSGLCIDKANSGYKLIASSGSLTSDTSNAPFTIAPGTATQLVVLTQPSTAVAETNISPAVIVLALDDYDNLDTSYNSKVFANVKIGAGSLTGTNPFASSGVATFSDLKINLAGSGYTLLFSSVAGTVVSNAFDITAIPSAANSEFGVSTSSEAAGTLVTYSAIINDVNDNPVGAGVTVSFSMNNSINVDTPDVSCVTDASGLCSTTATSTIVGTTTVSASISAGSIANIIAGLGNITAWVAGTPDADMSNFGVASSVANMNSSVSLEAELRDQFGNLVENESVTFQLIDTNGASTPPSVGCTTFTDANGVCSSSVTSSSTGTTTVKAFFGFPSAEITNTNTYNGLGKVITWQ